MLKSVAGLTSVIAIMAVIGGASAQNNTNVNVNDSTSNATSNAGAASQSGSSSRSNAANQGNRQNITFNSPGETRSTNNSTGSFSNNNRDAVSYSGGTNNTVHNTGDQTIRTTPTVYAPPVSGGNPCTLAVSGGVSVIGWGAAAGGTFVDEDCANRQKIAMIHNAGYAGAAKELMCNDKNTYFAFRTAGQPCAYRAAFEGNMAPPAAGQPIPVAAPVPVMAPPPPVVAGPKQYQRCNPRAGIVDNCISG